ncbi:unnamed protein product [Pleuronectes platessa]|uniref:Uncharacterized protein n=1 Tax=Pleuronectes platessa TaxID=8262 RepID=A0A9N7W5X4_PLEPL|nr:unnamed protein product [Pleuronectes platessa]
MTAVPPPHPWEVRSPEVLRRNGIRQRGRAPVVEMVQRGSARCHVPIFAVFFSTDNGFLLRLRTKTMKNIEVGLMSDASSPVGISAARSSSRPPHYPEQLFGEI